MAAATGVGVGGGGDFFPPTYRSILVRRNKVLTCLLFMTTDMTIDMKTYIHDSVNYLTLVVCDIIVHDR